MCLRVFIMLPEPSPCNRLRAWHRRINRISYEAVICCFLDFLVSYALVSKHSYLKSPFIADFSIQNYDVRQLCLITRGYPPSSLTQRLPASRAELTMCSTSAKAYKKTQKQGTGIQKRHYFQWSHQLTYSDIRHLIWRALFWQYALTCYPMLDLTYLNIFWHSIRHSIYSI